MDRVWVLLVSVALAVQALNNFQKAKKLNEAFRRIEAIEAELGQ